MVTHKGLTRGLMLGLTQEVSCVVIHSAVTSTTGLVTESQDTGGMRPAQTQPVSRKKCALKNRVIVSPLFKLRKHSSIWVTVLLCLLKTEVLLLL